MDPIDKFQKKIDAYEKKAIKKIMGNKKKRGAYHFQMLLFWSVLIGLIIIVILYFFI